MTSRNKNDVINREKAENEPSKGEQSYLCKVLREKLVQNVNELEVQQRDPNSPLYSVKSFEELDLRHDLLKEGVISKFF